MEGMNVTLTIIANESTTFNVSVRVTLGSAGTLIIMEYVWTFVYVYVCMYVCTCIGLYIHVHVDIPRLS